MHMAITVQRVCSCLVHAQGERGSACSHYIQHVLGNVQRCFDPFGDTLFEKELWTWQPNPVEGTYPRCRPIYAGKTVSWGAAHGVKYFCFVISDLPVIASVGSDKSDVRCRSLPRNIPQVKAHTAPAKILSTVRELPATMFSQWTAISSEGQRARVGGGNR